MLSSSLLTCNQNAAVDRLFEYDRTFLVADMGSGKTVVALTAMAELLEQGVVSHVLVVAPLKVARTVWAQEAKLWSHLHHLDIAVAVGDAKTRQKAVSRGAAITVINFENLPWLLRKAKLPCDYDGLVIDELSKMKAVGGAGFKALRPKLKSMFGWRVGLTGTPVSEDWEGLYGQVMVLDDGVALGTRRDVFYQKWFNQTDYKGYSFELKAGAATDIADRIRGLVHVLPDYRAELPPIKYRNVLLDMPTEVSEAYDAMVKDMAVEISGANVEIIADSSAALVGKLQQCASGFLYGEGEYGRETIRLSEYRVEAVCKRVAKYVSAGSNVMVPYWFQADYPLLRERLEEAGFRVGAVVDGVERAVANWNAGNLEVLLLHPRSAGHGLNLAMGGNIIIWFAPVWSRDLWEQTNARLWRRGQTKPVTVEVCMASGSVDELVQEKVRGKESFTKLFQKHLGV